MTLLVQPLQTCLQKAEREGETFIFLTNLSREYVNVRKVRNVHNVYLREMRLTSASFKTTS